MIKAIRSLGFVAVGMAWVCWSAAYASDPVIGAAPIVIPQSGGLLYQPSCPIGTFVSLSLCPTCPPYYLPQSFPLSFPANPENFGVFLYGAPPNVQSTLTCSSPEFPSSISFAIPICQSGKLESCVFRLRPKLHCPGCIRSDGGGVRG